MLVGDGIRSIGKVLTHCTDRKTKAPPVAVLADTEEENEGD